MKKNERIICFAWCVVFDEEQPKFSILSACKKLGAINGRILTTQNRETEIPYFKIRLIRSLYRLTVW
jgi:hypothetical protein